MGWRQSGATAIVAGTVDGDLLADVATALGTTLGDLLGVKVDPAERALVEALRAFVVATSGKG
jgi:hypothetical protein